MTIKLQEKSLALLKSGLNLLAFSGGIDSTALFFLLLEKRIDFDLAIVDYARRAQSKEEVAYAGALAKKHKKRLYLLCVEDLDSKEGLYSNFQHKARGLRYDFFESLIQKHGYNNLVLAQHLDDRLEWFFMQFSKGAGLNSLLGFNEVEPSYAGNRIYNRLRPLSHIRKADLLAYNNEKGLHYFIDSSNDSRDYERNRIRPLLQALFEPCKTAGLLNSLHYLMHERDRLYPRALVCMDDCLLYCQRGAEASLDLQRVDSMAKRLGYLLSHKQKAQISKLLESKAAPITPKDCLMGGMLIVGLNEDLLFVGKNEAPGDEVRIPKKLREAYRLARIPKKLRRLLYLKGLSTPGFV